MSPLIRRVLSVTLALGIGMGSEVFGAILHVREDAVAGGDGSSWSQAFPALETAIAAAMPGDEIWVSQGTYKPTAGADRSATYHLPGGISLRGGFAGDETSPDQRNPESSEIPTILSGEIGDPELTTDNTFHLITALDASAPILLEGFTITAAYDESTDSNGGAAIRGVNTSLVLRDCLFVKNHCSQSGGAVYVWNSTATIENCLFTQNTCDSNGGSLVSYASNLDISDCRFLSNYAKDGGALYLGTGESVIQRCFFLSNTSRFNGGALVTSEANNTFSNCSLAGNYAGSSGGAIHVYYSSPTFINCSITGNKAETNGGAIISTFSSSKFKNTIIWNNMAYGSTTLATSTFSNFNGNHYTKFSHSIVANSGGSGAWEGSFGVDQGNNLDLDPLFVTAGDPASAPNIAGDFHLLPNSPAIETGDVSSNLSLLDLDGNPRLTSDNNIDIGCYQFDDLLLIPNEETIREHRLLATADLYYEALLDLPDIYLAELDDVEIESVSPGSPFTASLDQNGKVSVRMTGQIGFGEITILVRKSGVEDRLEIGIHAILHSLKVSKEATGFADGSTWTNAYPDLHPALLAAQGTTVGPLQEIWIKEASYHPDSALGIPFALTEGVGIYGGFQGSESQLDERNPATYKSILTVATNPSAEELSTPVLNATRVGSRALMDGCTIIGHIYDQSAYWKNGATAFVLSRASPSIESCEFLDSSAGLSSGAVSCQESSAPTFNNCRFSGNRSFFSGGAVILHSSPAVFTSCLFEDNIASNIGSAVYSYQSSPVFEDCDFNTNGRRTLNYGSYRGGAVYSYQSVSKFTRCTFTSNSTNSDGGAIYTNESDATFDFCTFTSNTTGKNGASMFNLSSSTTITNCHFSTGYSYEAGGAIYNEETPAVIRNCSFLDNFSRDEGGAIKNLNSHGTIESCLFEKNHAEEAGGAIYNSSSNPILTNLLLRKNHSTLAGGGIANYFSSPVLFGCEFLWNRSDTSGGAISNEFASSGQIINCTIAGNSASTSGHAVWNHSSSNPSFRNTIISGNSSSPEASISNTNNAQPRFAYCLISGSGSSMAWDTTFGTDDGNNFDRDPGFLVPPHPSLDPARGADLRLRQSSQSIDAGNLMDPAPTEFDLLGNARLQGISIDLGAYEGGYAISFPTLYPSLSRDGDENENGFSNFLDYALGIDPKSPYSNAFQTKFNGEILEITRRHEAIDLGEILLMSPDLNRWTEMTEGIHYLQEQPEVAGSLETLRLRIITDTEHFSKMFYSHRFIEQ